MIKLAKLLKLSDLFFNRASKSLFDAEILIKYAAEVEDYDGVVPTEPAEIIAALEDAWDISMGDPFPAQLEQFISVYKDFMTSPVDEEYFDKAEALNTVWNRMANNPYLKLDSSDPDWEESFPPAKIIDLLSASLKTANTKYSRDLDDPSATINQASGVAKEQHEATVNPLTGGEMIDKGPGQMRSGNVLEQIRAAAKRHYAKLKAAGKYYTLDSIQKQIEQSNDPIEKERLEGIRNNYMAFLKLKEHASKSWKAIKSDPARKEKYDESNRARQLSFIKDTKLKNDLIDAIKNAPNPAEKIRLAKQLIVLERESVERRGFDLNDPFIENSPEVQKLLNPEEIIKRIDGRINRMQKNKNVGHETRRSKIELAKQSGDLEALSLLVRRQRDDIKSSNKKRIAKEVDANKEKAYNSPFFEKYVVDMKEAAKQSVIDPSPDNMKRKSAAELALLNAVEEYKTLLVAEENKKLLKLDAVINNIHELVGSSRGKSPKKLQEWFWSDNIPEDKKPVIYDLVSNIKSTIELFSGQMKPIMETLSKIASKLEDMLKDKATNEL